MLNRFAGSFDSFEYQMKKSNPATHSKPARKNTSVDSQFLWLWTSIETFYFAFGLGIGFYRCRISLRQSRRMYISYASIAFNCCQCTWFQFRLAITELEQKKKTKKRKKKKNATHKWQKPVTFTLHRLSLWIHRSHNCFNLNFASNTAPNLIKCKWIMKW